MNKEKPRPEYPRPQMVRKAWISLNGEWEFGFDDDNVGLKKNWQDKKNFDRKIVVPFPFQAELSGIGDTSFHDVVWYRREFEVPKEWDGKNIRLNIGACDYHGTVWVNGVEVADHKGGHTPFSADITQALKTDFSKNTIAVRAWDGSDDKELPRGKQFWKPKSSGIMYTRTTGLWQSVWLEPLSDTWLEDVHIISSPDDGTIEIKPEFCGPAQGLQCSVEITFSGKPVSAEIVATPTAIKITLAEKDRHLWSPENPNLYDIELTCTVDGEIVEHVELYAALRSVGIRGNQLLLNGEPYFLRSVLDQGYWQTGIYTAPSDGAIRQDVEHTKSFGFNGARKHQKVEDPRWLYWCDRLGLLVWGEMANTWEFSKTSNERFVSEWSEAIKRDRNHPCIVCWVPINESWGVPEVSCEGDQQRFLLQVYNLTKKLDPTRPVVDNDGWEHLETDIFTIHDYTDSGDQFKLHTQVWEESPGLWAEKYRKPLVEGAEYNGQPVVISEYGGIALKTSVNTKQEGWGYGTSAVDEEAFLARLESITKAILDTPWIAGFCYTQLTDVEQEVNGLLTYGREIKVDPEKIAAIIGGKSANIFS